MNTTLENLKTLTTLFNTNKLPENLLRKIGLWQDRKYISDITIYYDENYELQFCILVENGYDATDTIYVDAITVDKHLNGEENV